MSEMDGPAGPEPTVTPGASGSSDPVVVRPRVVAIVAAAAAPLLLAGALLATVTSPAARAGLLVLVAMLGAALVVPTVRFRLEVHRDGTLRKRSWRTTEVDLTRLSALHTRRDHPWSVHEQGVVGFEDRDGRNVEVPLVPISFLGGDHWVALAPWIERSGLPLSGAAAGQIERYLHDELDVQEANGRAHASALTSARRGTFSPHRCGPAYDERSFGWLLAAGFALLLVAAARTGMVPEDQLAMWTALFLAVAVGCGAASVVRMRAGLELAADGRLVRRGVLRTARVDLRRVARVQLDPDHPFIDTADGGRRLVGRRLPKLRVADEDGGEVRIELASTWQGLAPILRSVLAAADARGVDLSDPTREYLGFYSGVVARATWGIPSRREDRDT
jgi:hypothetical protein